MIKGNNPRAPAGQAGEAEVNFEFDSPNSHTGAYTQAPILVLSRAANIIDVVKRAAPAGSRVLSVPDLDKIADQLPALLPGVLVIDTACVSDVSSTVTQLTQHFPELVVVVTGKSEDGAALMRLTAAGQIYRFLLAPLSHGQTKLSLEAAMTQHMALGAAANRRSIADSSSGSERKNYTPAYIALGLGLIVVVGSIWWFVSRMDAGQTPVQPAAAVQQATQAVQNPMAKELALADAAFAAGKYLEPPGESALDLYRSALSIDPNNAQAKAGIQQVAGKILERAETALTAEKLEDAVTALEQVRGIDPNNSRLQFMDSQVGRERERMKLTQAQEVSKKVRSLLADATQNIEEGRLLFPAGNNARDSILEARRTDPTDPTVVQTLRTFNSKLIDSAKQAAEQGQIDQAQNYLSTARQLGYAGNELSAVERSLSDARTAAGKRAGLDALVSNARKRIAEGQLLAPAGDSARDLIANIRATDPARAELEDLSKALSTRLIDAARQAIAAKQYDQAQQSLSAARQVSVKSNEAALVQTERELTALQKPTETVNTAAAILPPVQLKRTKTVTPNFPADAKKKGVSGWVEVSFLVAGNGAVQDVKITKADPPGVFDQSALEAIQQWRFEPPTRDGKSTTQRTNIRLRFDSSK